MGADKVFTEKDVEPHNSEEDCWMILGNPGEKKVYDVTKFLEDHPGGPEILTDVGGGKRSLSSVTHMFHSPMLQEKTQTMSSRFLIHTYHSAFC